MSEIDAVPQRLAAATAERQPTLSHTEEEEEEEERKLL
jgi:hypothetical protein